jgi:hypothetical protein
MIDRATHISVAGRAFHGTYGEKSVVNRATDRVQLYLERIEKFVQPPAHNIRDACEIEFRTELSESLFCTVVK